MGDIHWCVGMYASASTWLFNVARAIAETSVGSDAYRSCFVQRMSDIQARLPPDVRPVTVVKSHETYEGADSWLAARARSILVTIRDPRDAVLSMMRHQQYDFETSVEYAIRSAIACAQHVNDPRALVLRFEDGFTTDSKTVGRVAAAMGCDITADDVDRIHQAHTRAAVEAKIAELGRSNRILRQVDGPDYMDLETQWHLHHANREGRVGIWRSELGGARLNEVQFRMGALMELLNYACEYG